jgi:mRNA interferase HigB
MIVITKGAIHAFAAKHPRSALPLNEWFRKTAAADWGKFQEVKSAFGTVDYVGEDRYVFNIGGNNYRLIAMIHFSIRTVYIRAILSHKEYDVLSKAGKLQGL